MPTSEYRHPPHPALARLALAVLVTALPASAADWILPSSARWPGIAGAFFTTDLCVANLDERDVTVRLRFHRHDENGSFGPEVSYPLRAGEAVTFVDVLRSVFGFSLDWGAIRVSADTPLLAVTSQTSTPAARGGSYGQSVPGFPEAMLARRDAPARITGIRQDAESRTNLVLANTIDDHLLVRIELFGPDGLAVGTARDRVLPPFGMTQLTAVVEELAGAGSRIDGGRVVVSTTHADGAFAAYASVIDAGTNDPRTLLPSPPPDPTRTWIVPSSARAPGAAGAFYTTDLTLTNGGGGPALAWLRFLGHDVDGSNGPVHGLEIPAGGTVRLRDVLGRLFGLPEGYGAILVDSDVTELSIDAETSTPSPEGGTFGQTVPAVPSGSLARAGTVIWLGGLREDARFRTNLVLANPGSTGIEVRVELRSETGLPLAAGSWTLPSSGMTQVTRVVADLLGVDAALTGGQLLLSTPTPGGAFTAYASVIDAETNDPRAVLPR